MIDNNDACSAKRKDKYEPPQAVRLSDADVAYGACSRGNSFTNDCYRGNRVVSGNCITGMRPTDQCAQGMSF